MRFFSIIFGICLFVFACDNAQTPQIQKMPESEPVVSFDAEGKKAVVYTTADSTELRLDRKVADKFSKVGQPLETEVVVFVNPNVRFQKFVGIGAAITDAAAETFYKLTPEVQSEFLKAHFDKDQGVGYSIIRTNINSCDFSSDTYTYIEEGDKELKTFSVDHDKKYKLPLIKKAFEVSKNNLVLFASPWSPPAFMKDTKNMLHGGKLLPEYYDAWALYYSKFIKAYKNEGVPVWGITIQNEPMAKQTWESCIYEAEEERDFLKKHLGPSLNNEGLGDVKIIVWDHNRDLLVHRANVILGDADAAKYVWGVGFHWYEPWAGGQMMYQNVDLVHKSFPNVNLIFTEGCTERFSQQRYQAWDNGEKYGSSIINDLNAGTVAWTDWNILLDETGGPNHVGNFCFAPVHADTQSGKLIYTPAYYYIGHFSKFIRPDATRLSTSSSRSHLLSTSFLNTDGTMVTVVMNYTNLKINYKIMVADQAISLEILPHAIQTVVY